MIREVIAETESIVIPMNKSGERVFETFKAIAERHLEMAREAACEFISSHFPKAERIEKVDEIAMFDLKYTAFFELPYGIKRGVTYDYITREVYFEGT